MSKKIHVVSDATFYIRFLDDIDMPIDLVKFLTTYQYHYGTIILNEVSQSKNFIKIKGEFLTLCIHYKYDDYDYRALFAPILTRNEKHRYDGEYEAIMIAYHLNEYRNLDILIIDDKSPRNLVIRNFPKFANKLRRTEELICNSYMPHSAIGKEKVIEILEQIKDKAIKGICRVPPDAIDEMLIALKLK